MAASPIGSFDGKIGGGKAGWGQIGLVGWALDDSGVRAVDIVVDGVVYQRAVYGLNRPDVTRRNPGYPNSNAPGFTAQLDSTRFLNGIHHLSILVTAVDGEQKELGPVRAILFRNASHMLAPFGKITFPPRDAELRGRCSADPTRRYSIVTGWVLDAGNFETSPDTGVAYVELVLDGAIQANSKVSCVFFPSLGFLENCYGLPSQTLTYVYPSLPDSDRGKFRFALDVGALVGPNGPYVPGAHTITIRAGDYGDQVRNIGSVNVFLSCDDQEGNERSKGAIEEPNKFQPWFKTITVKGWAIDFNGLNTINIRVNGLSVGNATLGLPRVDVAELYPGYPSVASSGWTFSFDTTTVNDGHVTFEVWALDVLGDWTLIGEVDAIIDNRDHP
jgi:N-acetylmuramoyl-L-alanine amidase